MENYEQIKQNTKNFLTENLEIIFKEKKTYGEIMHKDQKKTRKQNLF